MVGIAILVTNGLKKLGFPTGGIFHSKKSMESLVQTYNIVTKWCCYRDIYGSTVE